MDQRMGRVHDLMVFVPSSGVAGIVNIGMVRLGPLLSMVSRQHKTKFYRVLAARKKKNSALR